MTIKSQRLRKFLKFFGLKVKAYRTPKQQRATRKAYKALRAWRKNKH